MNYDKALYRLDDMIDEMKKLKKAILKAKNGNEHYLDEICLLHLTDEYQYSETQIMIEDKLIDLFICILTQRYSDDEFEVKHNMLNRYKYSSELYQLIGVDTVYSKYILNDEEGLLQYSYNEALIRLERKGWYSCNIQSKCPWTIQELIKYNSPDIISASGKDVILTKLKEVTH